MIDNAEKITAVKEQMLQAFHLRHACRIFDPARKISDDDFDYILETGRLSPSSFGLEPWQFVVVQNPTIREKLLPVTWGATRTLPTASHFVLLLTRTKADLEPSGEYISDFLKNVKHMPDNVLARHQKNLEDFFNHDFAYGDNDRAVFEWACRQTYIALGNMMTAAAMIGVDSCPIEGFVKADAEEVLRGEGILKGNLGLTCMVAFGYRASEPERAKTRRPVEQVVAWVE